MVYMAGIIVTTENKQNGDIDDKTQKEGLSGVINDPCKPIQTELSRKLLDLLSPNVAEALEAGTTTIDFTVADSEIVSLLYTTGSGRSQRSVTFPIDDETAAGIAAAADELAGMTALDPA